MKKWIGVFISIGIFMFFINIPAWAEKLYVTDVLKLRLWDKKETGRKVIKIVGSGELLDVISKDDQWANVRTSDGKEGWLQKRFLVSKMTHNRKLARLERKHKALMIQNSVLLEENAKLKTDNAQMKEELDRTKRTSNEIAESFESLKTESAGFVELKAKYDKVSAQLKTQSLKGQKLESQLEEYETNQTIRWFLSGAGVLLLGLILGLSLRRKRRRSLLS